jgi:hypothetical protein
MKNKYQHAFMCLIGEIFKEMGNINDTYLLWHNLVRPGESLPYITPSRPPLVLLSFTYGSLEETQQELN